MDNQKKFHIEINRATDKHFLDIAGSMNDILAFTMEAIKMVYDMFEKEKSKKVYRQFVIDSIKEELPFLNEQEMDEVLVSKLTKFICRNLSNKDIDELLPNDLMPETKKKATKIDLVDITKKDIDNEE